MSNGININLGSGAFTTTMLTGGIALLVTSGFINATSPDMSGNLYVSGWLLIFVSIILYLVRWGYKYWLLKSKSGIM